MSNDVVIRAEGLGKKYSIGHRAANRQSTLRDAISHNIANLARTTRDMLQGKPIIAGDEIEEFWALKDVSFEIKRGDVVGIIGGNGAGKSTLLKVLSRITEPSAGTVAIRGRVASLLEVGTGFHPELSGRENIFLNGAILGMTRAEVRQSFDEIVAFAEIEKFLDTPVKRYSSGMYVRLAFAIAAHLQPEILIVDEVLAVGDAEFQKKCLGKMHDVAGEGRTVLFVSHNMSTIRALCSRGLLLEAGSLTIDGEIKEVASSYEAGGSSPEAFISELQINDEPHITRAEAKFLDDRITLILNVASPRRDKVIINCHFRDSTGAPIGMASMGGFDPDQLIILEPGEKQIILEVSLPMLAVGKYQMSLNIERPYRQFVQRLDDVLSFNVNRTPTNRHGRVLNSAWREGAIEFPAILINSGQSG